MNLSGWGRYPRCECSIARPRSEDDVRTLVARGDLIARGNGRAYGDSALSSTNTADMRAFNRMLHFDADTGCLTAEAGVQLVEVISAFLPRGWFPAVTPGTKFVTLGGMAAADVHGKNHHKHGSFGAFTDWLDIMDPDGVVRRCSAADNADLFSWTIGGMGLTGVILRIAFRLRRVETAWIRQTTIPAANLDAAFDAFETHHDASYSVAWIDCLASGANVGRSLIILGEHAARDEIPVSHCARPFATEPRRTRSVPIDLPGGVLNWLSVRAFNALYYWNGRRSPAVQLVDWDSYFYPLDAIHDWNRIYGRGGLVQFQCVLPLESASAGLKSLLRITSAAGAGSFLAVLKRFGEQKSRFSFPMAGYTLALDFSVNRRTLAVIDRLDAVALDHGGRFYLAKDSRMSAATLAASDERVAAFQAMRRRTKSSEAFSSAQSKRLAL
jgi:decaprenylphospho-beta-D-ribofuranose 2-oxidase